MMITRSVQISSHSSHLSFFLYNMYEEYESLETKIYSLSGCEKRNILASRVRS